MPRPRVYSIPLIHNDNNEYMRLKRGIETASSNGGCVVAYEFPNLPQTREFFSKILGSSSKDLGAKIEAMLRIANVYSDNFEYVEANLIEIDHAKHKGQVKEAYPIDIKHVIDRKDARDVEFKRLSLDMDDIIKKISHSVLESDSFGMLLGLIRDEASVFSKMLDIRNVEMASNVNGIISNEKGQNVVLMTGALHVPGIIRLLKDGGIDVTQLYTPEEVAGVFWLKYGALREARIIDGLDKCKNLYRYSLLMAAIVIESQKGISSPSDSEIKEIMRVDSAEEAAAYYKKLQDFYRTEFEKRLPILDMLKDVPIIEPSKGVPILGQKPEK